MISQERLAELEARYSNATPGPCPVCLGELSMQRAGGGAITWACNAHYTASRIVTRAGDSDVIALIEAYRTPTGLDREQVARIIDPVVFDQWDRWGNKEPNFNVSSSHMSSARDDCDDAFAKADRIIALGVVASPTERLIERAREMRPHEGAEKDVARILEEEYPDETSCAMAQRIAKRIVGCFVASPEGNSPAASLPVSEQTVPEPAGVGSIRWNHEDARIALKAAHVEGARAMAEFAGLPQDDLDEAGYDYADGVLPFTSPPEPEAKTGGAESLDKWAALMAQASELSEKIDAELHAPSPAPAVGVDARIDETDAAANGEIVGLIRQAARRVTGGNCTFADDDLDGLAELAQRAIDAGLTEGLHTTVTDSIARKAALSTSPLAKGDG